MAKESTVLLYFSMAIATVFVALFCTAFIYDMTHKEYDIPSGIYPLLTTIIGAIFGFVYKRTQDA